MLREDEAEAALNRFDSLARHCPAGYAPVSERLNALFGCGGWSGDVGRHDFHLFLEFQREHPPEDPEGCHLTQDDLIGPTSLDCLFDGQRGDWCRGFVFSSECGAEFPDLVNACSP